MSEPIWRWSATRVAAAIRSREISAREALDDCLARMAAVNGKINAVTVDLSDQAREAAERADRAVAEGSPLGPLHGVPVTIKENADQQGCATTNGVVAYRDVIAPTDCPAVANLKKAGAIIVGRTNTPAFSFRIDTVNDLRGRTYNPWSRTHTPGGSSGGAASSVAAGITALAHGSDIAGSIRFPAFACGIAGIRPSFGRVASYNPTQAVERSLSSQLMSVQGPLARCVADLRLGLSAMAARDARDPWWIGAALEGPIPSKPVRVTVVTAADDLAGIAPHPDVAAALTQAARWLADAGYDVVAERTPGFTRAQQLWFEMQLPEFREYLLPAIEKDGDDGIRTATRLMLDNVPATGALPYMKALAERARLVRDWTALLDRVPLVLAPVSAAPVYAQGFDVENAARTRTVWRECSTLMAVPVLGLPAAVVPTGTAGGLPLGVQLIGPRFREDLCLAAAEAIEARAGALTPLDPRW